MKFKKKKDFVRPTIQPSSQSNGKKWILENLKTSYFYNLILFPHIGQRLLVFHQMIPVLV